jgi:hypothetical protein
MNSILIGPNAVTAIHIQAEAIVEADHAENCAPRKVALVQPGANGLRDVRLEYDLRGALRARGCMDYQRPAIVGGPRPILNILAQI